MTQYADLEIGLHRRDADRYHLELRFSRPDSDTDDRLVQGDALWVKFDWEGLRKQSLNAAEYGKLLGAQLFAAQEVRIAFENARTAAQTLGASLRVRLFIGPSALDLHRLRWETLRDPQDQTCILTNENMLFSRYLSSLDWRPVRLRPQAELRALVVIANPTDITEHQMAALNVADELNRAKSGLGVIPVTELASGGQATIQNLATHLRDGDDILYLVAHGMLVDNEPWVWLEQADGKTQRVSGAELVTRIKELEQRPRLVVLASCQSAGTGDEARTGDEGALAALGPRLAEAGIPAVIAMQGNITIKTLDTFMPVFFQELQRDGQIDRAMAVARGAVRERPDWWLPVLFMRLKSGRIWYAPGFAEEQGGLQKWPALVRSIQRNRCTPILGPGLTEPLFGSWQEMARRWAEKYRFPMAPYQRENLPQVAQYLSVHQDPMFLRDEFETYLKEALLARHANLFPEGVNRSHLKDILAAIAARHFGQGEPTEPHRALAALPLPVYITTDPCDLLEQALTAAGKAPQVELCRWNNDVEDLPSVYDQNPDYRSTPEKPLVYHLFGSLSEPRSLVLTEDDYFDFLIGVTRNKDLIPAGLRRALVDAALLFLGFQMDEWAFRVLFRSIMNREGGSRRRDYAHVAAQINPEEGRILEPEGARRYLERYFQDASISIYWGSVEDFTKELAKQLNSK